MCKRKKSIEFIVGVLSFIAIITSALINGYMAMQNQKLILENQKINIEISNKIKDKDRLYIHINTIHDIMSDFRNLISNTNFNTRLAISTINKIENETIKIKYFSSEQFIRITEQFKDAIFICIKNKLSTKENQPFDSDLVKDCFEIYDEWCDLSKLEIKNNMYNE